MQELRKIGKRLLSLVLTAAMVATMMPAAVFAAEGDVPRGASSLGVSSIGTIKSIDKLEEPFAPLAIENLPDHIYALTVALDTPAEELNLPKALGAQVERTVTEGEATTTEQETIPVTWNSNKEYKSDENGQFIYTAVLPEGYILAEGVALPQICVLVDSGNALPGVMPRAGVYCICMVQCVGFSTNDCQLCLSSGVMVGAICKPRGLVIDDVTVSGIVGKELVGGITTTLTTWGKDSKFVRSDGTEDVTNWFTGLPAGITVEATFDEAHDSYITLTFSGTPTEQSTAAMSITIPGDSTSNFIDPFGANYQSVNNANAKFNIEANPLAHNLSTDGALELNIYFDQLPQIVCDKGCSETNPHIVTSNGQTNNTITLVGGSHYVVLNNVNISSEYNSPISTENDSAYLYLTIKGTNTLTATGDGKAGIFSKNGSSMDAGLIINGEKADSLTVQGGKGAAGIGGNDALSGHITINGGVINATGGESGAGIGSGTNINDLIGDLSYFTINDGTITATGGGNGAAGIGLGDHGAVGSSGMVITITGGDVTAVGTGASAYGYGSAPGIGSVQHDVDIAVEGGIVNAQGDGSAFNLGTGGGTTLTFTDTKAKYNTATFGTATYTGAINISNGKIYEGAEGTANVAKDIKSMPIYKGTEAADVSGTPAAKTDTTVTLAAVTAPTDETIEYAYSTTSTAPTDGWQDSTAFTGLTANTQYYFFARVKAADKHWEGAASTGTAITTAAAVVTFVPVTGITGVPTTATAGTPLTLSGTVAPTDATNKTIVWSVKSAGTTGATISGSTLSTTAAGTVTVTAIITNGLTDDSNYTQDFTIAATVPVTGITGVPTAATAGTPLNLSGTVAPANATNKTIVWTVNSAGTTGAAISGSTLNTTATGTVTVTATITNGLTATTNYTQNFTITVNAADKTALNTAITAATTVGNSAIVSDSPASSVSSGTKFVTTAEMAALTDAIAAAQAVADNTGSTEAEITTAIGTLNTAVTAFNAAIKTGTYSSGGGGGGSTPSGNVIDSPVGTKTAPPVVTDAVKDAVAKGITNASTSVTFNNYTALAPDGIKAILDSAAAATKGTKVKLNLLVNFDAGPKNQVTSRITLDPAALAKELTAKNVTGKLPLGVWFDRTKDTKVQSVNTLFGKHFSNKVVSVVYDQSSTLAINAEFCAKLNLEKTFGTDKNLYFYTYNNTTNIYKRILLPDYRVDKNGYAHITAPFGGSIIITDKPLTDK